jgi:hypothetical protein
VDEVQGMLFVTSDANTPDLGNMKRLQLLATRLLGFGLFAL